MSGALRLSTARSLALTSDLVAHVTRPMPDPGRDPALTYHTDDEFEVMADRLLARHPAGQDLTIFACGSLIWRPACPTNGSFRAVLHGWHRVFCLKITRWRATREQPGLMMALDRGGRCNGVGLTIPAAEARDSLILLLKREVSVKPSNNVARWVKIDSDNGTGNAIAFVIDRQGPNYIGRLPLAQEAELIAAACGHGGSCAEYLHNTIVHLAEFGIHDRNLWALQGLVAEKIAGRAQSGAAPCDC